MKEIESQRDRHTDRGKESTKKKALESMKLTVRENNSDGEGESVRQRDRNEGGRQRERKKGGGRLRERGQGRERRGGGGRETEG